MPNTPRHRRSISTAVGCSLLAATLLAAPAGADEPSIADEKSSPLTPTLQQLSRGVRPAKPGPLTPALPEENEPGGIITRPNGRVLVDVRLAAISETSLDQLRQAGARIRFVDETLRTVTAAIYPADLDSLAALSPLVESVHEVLTPITNAACPTGNFVSEGVAQLKANLARANFSVTGRDVTVGVLSDSYDTLGGASNDVANGELPGAGNPCGNTSTVGNAEGPAGSIDEGRAMAQIVHDVAPGARILVASAFFGELAFAQSIRDLAAQGADIIVDDITYFSEPYYQDGPIAKAVADVTAQGVTYFSSAANSNKILGGKNVASYEAQAFRPTACPAAIVTAYGSSPVTCHDFNPGGGVDTTYGFSVQDSLKYGLNWNEPQFGVATDLDLCVLDNSNVFVGCAADNNFTTQRPFEFSSLTVTGNPSASYVVVRFAGSGTPRFKFISHRSGLTSVEYNTSAGGDVIGPTIFGHNASRPGVTVAAVPFNNSAVVEDFSSIGPATYCWGPVVDTSPAAAIAPCQTATVDLAATDGTQNSFFGSGSPPRFFGTSAAAPHAAAVAALLLDKEQCLTPTQVIATLKASGRSVGSAGTDVVGAGLVDAQAALTSAAAFNCDTSAPRVDIAMPAGWTNAATVGGTVTARDHRLVSALSCTGATLTGLGGLGTPTASGTLTTTGEGLRTITCQGSDLEGNSGAGPGSTSSITVGIDTVAPVVTCRPTTLTAGQPGSVVADVSDALSGPATATVSSSVPTRAPGSSTVSLTGSDVAGNTATAACAYTVRSAARVSGPSAMKVGVKKRFTARGFPAAARITWTVKRGKKTLDSRRQRTSTSGTSAVRVSFPRTGRYSVTATSGPIKASVRVRVR
jgi:hypothetical protein